MTIVPVDNTLEFSLDGYKNTSTGEFINDAVVTLEITDLCGEYVSGISQPIPMLYQTGSSGDYIATIPHDIGIEPYEKYKSIITATSPGVVFKQECVFDTVRNTC